jgi:DNA-binding response OmpR family regulator
VPRGRILVVDDDAKTAASVRLYLEHAGYEVEVAGDGRTALDQARADPPPDLIVLDWMLPQLDGLTVCRLLQAESAVPVILLTARTTEPERLEGLTLGADDYVTKPFSPRELVARVGVVLRRTRRDDSDSARVVAGLVTVDPLRHEAAVSGQAVELTPREFALLLCLARSPGRVFTRRELRDRAFGPDSEALDRTVDAHVMNLRRKLGEDVPIETVFGVGYRIAGQRRG